MKKIFVLLVMATLMAGCVNGKFVKRSSANNCGGTGWTHTAIHYGDSRLVVIPLSDVVAGEEMRFFLVPQIRGRGAIDYSAAEVTVKSVPENGFIATRAVTFTKTTPIISTCVKEGLALDDKFKYIVEVRYGGKLIAMLDPRAVVIDK